MTPTAEGADRSGVPDETPVHRASYWEFVAIPIRRRRFVLLCALLFCGLQTARHLTSSGYTSGATFQPRNSLSSLSGRLGQIASLSGVGSQLLTERGSYSIDFYAYAMTTRSLLDRMASRTYQLSDGRETTLEELLKVRSTSEERRRRRTRRWMAKALDVKKVSKGTVVVFRVTTPWPEISYQLAQAILVDMDSFTSNLRQSDYNREKEFINQQLKLTERDVRAWEDTLQTFLAANRRVGEYSELRFKQSRIESELRQHRTLHTELQVNYLQAGVREARETRSFVVLDYPQLPELSDRANMSPTLLLRMLLMGLVAGTILAVGLEWLVRMWDFRNPVVTATREAWPRLTSLPLLRALFWHTEAFEHKERSP